MATVLKPGDGSPAPPPPYAQAMAPGYQPPYPASQPVAPGYQPPYPASQPVAPGYQPPYPASQPVAPGYQAPYPPSFQAPGQVPPPTGYPQNVCPMQNATDSQPFLATNPDTSPSQTSPSETTPASTRPWDDDVGFTGSSFSDKAIRRAFIRKVYLILTCQLLVTIAFIVFFLCYSPAKEWIQLNTWFYYVSYATFLVTYIALVCCPGVRRKWPGNFICLAIFTLAFSYMAGTISSMYDTQSVLVAAGITAAVCLSISLFAIQTKVDFTMCSGLLFALCMVVFFFGWSCLIVYLTIGPSYILQCVYGAVAALLFALFLAYDTQMLIGGRKYELSPEEYIFGSLQLYLDIVYLFLIILSLFGGKD